MSYTLVKHTAPIARTSWWKNEDRMEPSNVWWLSGHGLSRPATDIEIDLWQQGGGRCDKLCSCLRAAGHPGGCNTSRGDQAA